MMVHVPWNSHVLMIVVLLFKHDWVILQMSTNPTVASCRTAAMRCIADIQHINRQLEALPRHHLFRNEERLELLQHLEEARFELSIQLQLLNELLTEL